MKNFTHIPVLLKEAVDALNVTSGKKYIDATLGGGGHSSEIIKLGGLVLGIDQDQDAVEFVIQTQELSVKNKVLSVVKGNFADIKKIAVENGFEKVDGILFDLGVSSYQLDASGRGFSMRKDEKLDMRMDMDADLTAYDVINKYSRDRLSEIFLTYGEEHNAIKIAEAITFNRKKMPIETTKQLSDIIERIGHKSEAIHPATRVFQAVRIEVNDELEVIKKSTKDACELLNPHGRLVVISFHSLEDRIVKQTFEKFKKENMGITLTKKPLTAGFSETVKNRRARSAKLRIFEKK